jgi:hypothetical protein
MIARWKQNSKYRRQDRQLSVGYIRTVIAAAPSSTVKTPLFVFLTASTCGNGP